MGSRGRAAVLPYWRGNAIYSQRILGKHVHCARRQRRISLLYPATLLSDTASLFAEEQNCKSLYSGMRDPCDFYRSSRSADKSHPSRSYRRGLPYTCADRAPDTTGEQLVKTITILCRERSSGAASIIDHCRTVFS